MHAIVVVLMIVVVLALVFMSPLYAPSVKKLEDDISSTKSSMTNSNSKSSSTHVAPSGSVMSDGTRKAWLDTVTNDGGYHESNDSGASDYHESYDHMEDYQKVLEAEVIDGRMVDQQANWVSEVAPKSQTAMKVGSMDETAALAAWNGWGLKTFAMEAPPNHGDPLFVLEFDNDDYKEMRTSFCL